MAKLQVRALAQAAGVSPNTVTRAEAGQSVNTATLGAIRTALEAHGVRFTETGGVEPTDQV